MKRSVILMGGKTYVLSLPSQWVKKYNIQKGEELNLEEKDNSIIVRTDHVPVQQEFVLDCSHLDLMLGRVLGAIYKCGYSRVKVQYHSKEQLHQIEQTLQRTLIGFEIVRQEKNFLVIESLTEIQAQEFDASLKRLFFSLEIMGDDLYFALLKHDLGNLQRVIDKDGQINRLADFCRRVINSGQTQFLKKPQLLYYLVEQLEKIGDAYKDIARFALASSESFDSSLQDFYKKIQAIFLSFRELFYKFSLDSFEQFGKTFYSLREERSTSVSSSKNRLGFYLDHLLELIIDMNGILLTYNL